MDSTIDRVTPPPVTPPPVTPPPVRTPEEQITATAVPLIQSGADSAGGGGGAAPVDGVAIQPKNEDQDKVEAYIQALREVTTKEQLDGLKGLLREILAIVDRYTEKESGLLATVINIFNRVTMRGSYPWTAKHQEIMELIAEKQKNIAQTLTNNAGRKTETVTRINQIKRQLEEGIDSIRMSCSIPAALKEQAIVEFLAQNESIINQFKGLVAEAFTYDIKSSEAFFKEICNFGIRYLGINLVSNNVATQNQQLANEFDDFTQWVFTHFPEFAFEPGEHDHQETFRQSGDLPKIQEAFAVYQKERKFDDLKAYIEQNKSTLSETNPQAFRNNIAGIIKKLLEEELIGKVNIDVNSLPKFSTSLFSIFLSADLNTYTYNSISRGFSLSGIIFKEVNNEMTMILEGVTNNPVYISFLTRFNLESGTEKFRISLVKFILFGNTDAEEYTEAEKVFVEAIVNSGRFKAIEAIRNCVKRLIKEGGVESD
jgi:hypothetical protein